MNEAKTVAVFGGTGFLGRRVVRHLRDRGFAVRVAARHPERAAALFSDDALLTATAADIADDASVMRALAGARGVVNAVSLYAEKGGRTFHGVHVEAAARLAAAARRAGVERLVQLSGIGADAQARSAYVRSRGEGETAVTAAFPGAVVIRPSAMFAAEDGFTASIAAMMHKASVFPLFGTGTTRLQPAFVEDVAEAIARILAAPAPAPLYEFGGADVLTYRALVQRIAGQCGRRALLLPVPFALWRLLAAVAGWLPNPPLTEGMVALMRRDNVVSGNAAAFADLGIAPHGIAAAFGGSNGDHAA